MGKEKDTNALPSDYTANVGGDTPFKSLQNRLTRFHPHHRLPDYKKTRHGLYRASFFQRVLEVIIDGMRQGLIILLGQTEKGARRYR